MREESVARRYAAALFDQAVKTESVAAVGEDFQRVAKTVADTPALRSFLAQPLVTEERKKQLLVNAFGGAIGPMTMAFLQLLVDKQRITLVDLVQQEFERLVLDYRGIAHATATSAVPLTAAQTAELVRSLETRTGKTIELETVVDPAVMGGVLVRIGDTVLDGTVQGSLERLREQLLSRH